MSTSADSQAIHCGNHISPEVDVRVRPAKRGREGWRSNRRLLSGLLWPLRILFALGLVYFVAHSLKFRQIGQAWSQARTGYVLAALGLLVPSLGFQCIRWWGFIRLLKPGSPFRESLRSLLAGLALGMVTPGRLGEFGRVWYVQGPHSHWAMAGLSFLDKYYTLALVVVSGAVSLLSLPGLGGLVGVHVAVAVGALLASVGGLLMLLLLSPSVLERIVGAAHRRFPGRQALSQLSSALAAFTPAAARRAMVWSILYFIVFLVQFHLLLNAFAPHPFFDSVRVICVAALVKSALPITPGGLGVAELSAVEVMKMVGGSPVAAFNASLLLFLNVLLPAVIGVPIILSSRPARRSGCEPSE